jgi:hypothetical protein
MKYSETDDQWHLIAEIKAIYRRNNYQPRGRRLVDFSQAQLTKHLEQLKAGKLPWITKDSSG